MSLLARVFAVALLLALIGFCILGFMATFEPLEPGTQLLWRVLYGTLGGICAAAILWLLLPRREGS
jgi:hypothetical protein